MRTLDLLRSSHSFAGVSETKNRRRGRGPMVNWTDDMIAELTSRWEAGESRGDIGRAMGVSPGAASHKMAWLGLREGVRPNRPPRWTFAMVDELTQRWQRGESASTIAEAMSGRNDGITRNSIIGKLGRLGLLHDTQRARPRFANPVTHPSEPLPVTLPRVQWLERDYSTDYVQLRSCA